MSGPEYIKDLKAKIAKGEAKYVIEQLFQLLSGHPTYGERVILLSGRFHSYYNGNIQGLSEQERTVENDLARALLHYLNYIEKDSSLLFYLESQLLKLRAISVIDSDPVLQRKKADEAQNLIKKNVEEIEHIITEGIGRLDAGEWLEENINVLVSFVLSRVRTGAYLRTFERSNEAPTAYFSCLIQYIATVLQSGESVNSEHTESYLLSYGVKKQRRHFPIYEKMFHVLIEHIEGLEDALDEKAQEQLLFYLQEFHKDYI